MVEKQTARDLLALTRRRVLHKARRLLWWTLHPTLHEGTTTKECNGRTNNSRPIGPYEDVCDVTRGRVGP